MPDNLTWQVSHLELSKKLRELEVKQESLFYWQETKYRNGKKRHFTIVDFGKMPDYPNPDALEFENYYSAFTVAELGEILPMGISTWKYEKDGVIKWAGKAPKIEDVFGAYDTEANARAKMLIYLLENDLIKL